MSRGPIGGADVAATTSAASPSSFAYHAATSECGFPEPHLGPGANRVWQLHVAVTTGGDVSCAGSPPVDGGVGGAVLDPAVLWPAMTKPAEVVEVVPGTVHCAPQCVVGSAAGWRACTPFALGL